MLYFPDVQKKAQEELDRVLGGRLPEFQDERNLPYLSAVVKEVMRCALHEWLFPLKFEVMVFYLGGGL